MKQKLKVFFNNFTAAKSVKNIRTLDSLFLQNRHLKHKTDQVFHLISILLKFGRDLPFSVRNKPKRNFKVL